MQTFKVRSLVQNLPKTVVIIPAFNEEKSIAKVIQHIPKNYVAEVIVVNNNSNDQTEKVASQAGATVLNETKQGYGAACLKGIAYARNINPAPEIIVFMDGDFADYPEELPNVIAPIVEGKADFVVGSRALGHKQPGALTPQQIWGNKLASFLLWVIYGQKATDLGPFRAIKFNKLLALNMQDTNYGWTVEMQIKAAQNNLAYTEVPVNYKVRIGTSKVSGTVKGTIMASYKILLTLFKYAIR